MNVLKPELVWVDGRCYRMLEKTESDGIVPYTEDDYFDHENQEEFNDADIEITPYGSSRFQHSFHVAKSFFPIIIGSKHTVRKRIETETKTSIRIPKMGQDGDIVITGFSRKGIITARRRIDLLIETSRKRLGYTHFLSIPLHDGHIIMKFNEFKNNVLTESGKGSRGVNEKIFQTPSKLHLTIGLLKLLDNAEREQAIAALEHCKKHIVKPIVKKYGQIPICLQGTEIMNDDPAETRVLYAKLIDKNNALQEVADEIVNYYASIGMLQKERETVKMHVTLMNMKFKQRDEDGSKAHKSTETFDGSGILKAHADTCFGETVLKEIHISQRHTIGTNGYYQTTAKIDLTMDS
ncbi:PREDICTED: activating signal cointegrator 1 complex subunit 1 [Dufourea novaeangliae]|uniref:Activating signal cointegrator 1 complex subunit 1 n=1 Tax=Dufourea novaeangliae TaxID=178035 RepID=A0A154P5X9_DUFNO|nr:PREDICTED: activating signal cointegrator 1 complex subunit 1 [Dufourea novaeangliae]KZC07262.1 Activating signal cointegrator 1 complex subunit 1 [Dufourea novaeangliae]